MERWTIAEPSEGQYHLLINHGGTPYYCKFDFAMQPAPECNGVEVGLATSADSVSIKWFPHLQSGMLRALDSFRDRGREWVSVRIEILKVYSHPLATTARGCERYGFSFVFDELPHRGVQISEQMHAEPGVAPGSVIS